MSFQLLLLMYSIPLVRSKWSYTPIDAKFTSIATSLDGNFAVATAAAQSGIPGGIWMTKGGDIWEKMLNASEEYLWNSISCNSDGSIVYASAGYHGIYRSSDYSNTYELTPGTNSNLNWIAVATDASGKYAYAIDAAYYPDNYARIIRTTDTGQTWYNSQSPNIYYTAPGTSITVSNDGKYVAATAYGIIFISTDYGESFEIGYTSGREYAHFYMFTSIASSSSGENVFTSTQSPNAIVMKNSDYGRRHIDWENLNDTQGIQVTSVASDSNGKRLYATTMGFTGTILQSDNGGDNWDPIDGDDVIVKQDYSAVATSGDGTYLYVVADNGIYSGVVLPNKPTAMPIAAPTANNPTQNPTASDETWVKTESPELTWTSTATARSNPAIVFGVGYGTDEATYANQGIWLSKDFGSSFTQVYQDSDLLWISIAVSNNGTYVYAVARPGGIFVSKDTGDTWDLAPETAKDEWESITTDSTGQIVYAITQKSDAYISRDYGNSFSVIESLSSLGVSQWGSVTTSSTGQHVYISTFENSVYSSTDYGESFTKYEDVEAGDDTGYLQSITTSSDGQYVFVCGQKNGYIHRSLDFGQTFMSTSAPVLDWRSITTSSTGEVVNAVSSGKGQYGAVYHSSSFGETFQKENGVNTITNNYSFNAASTSADGSVVYIANAMYIYVSK